MEEWSYQQRSDEGLGSGQDKHKPAQKELQQHTHTHTQQPTAHTCTNAQTPKHMRLLALYIHHALTYTQTHPCMHV